MDSRRHRADNSTPDQPTASTAPHHDNPAPRDDLDPTPDLRSDQPDPPKPNAEPHDRPPPSPDDEHREPDHHSEPDQHREPDHHREPDQHEERQETDRHSPDRAAESPSTDAQPDPFASYPPELRAHMHHDDTLSRLQYLSNPLPEPDRTSDGEPGEGPDDETDGVVKANAAATQPEPSSADTPPDVADNAKPTSTDDELEITEAEADEAAQEPTEEPALDAQPVTDRSADSTADRTDDSADLSANRTDDGSDSAEATTPPDRDRDSTTTSDDPTPADDVPAPLKPVTLETEINGETVGRRLERWEPARLNLPRPAPADVTTTEPTVETEHADQRSVDEENAVAYIAVNKETSPWLAPAADCEPAVQSVYASLDQGTGHAHSRHGPALDQQSLVARVTRFEDPAQPDRALRENGVDGLDSGNMHYCGRYATAVADPYVFAAVTAVLSEHPDVQEALRSDWGGPVPARLEIPISDLLGVDGHKYCIGFRLRGDWEEAKAQRKDWALARSSGADSGDVPEPEAEPVQTFEGGDIVVMFKRNLGASKFEIGTFFPDPPES